MYINMLTVLDAGLDSKSFYVDFNFSCHVHSVQVLQTVTATLVKICLQLYAFTRLFNKTHNQPAGERRVVSSNCFAQTRRKWVVLQALIVIAVAVKQKLYPRQPCRTYYSDPKYMLSTNGTS